MLNLSIAVLSFGIFQSGLVSLALLRKKTRHPSTIYLVLFLLVVALQLTFKVISKAWLWEHARTIYMISYNYGYLIGPLIYLFFRSQKTNIIFRKSDWIHFIPFVIRTALTLADEIFGMEPLMSLNWMFPWPTLHVISMVGYGIAAWKVIGNKRSMREFLVAVLVVECLIMFTIRFIVHNINTAPDLRLVFLTLTGLISWITFKMIASSDSFFAERNVSTVKMVATTTTKYSNSGLRSEEYNAILASLKYSIEKEQLFLDPEITIDSVAQKLSVSKHHLSQVINQNFGHSFTDLVYNWRLDQAQRILLDPPNSDLKISAIAFDLGFSSVSVFTTMFKRRFNVTPAVFRNQAANQQRSGNS